MFMVDLFTHIHSHFTKKYQLPWIILHIDDVNISNGTNVYSVVLFIIFNFALKAKRMVYIKNVYGNIFSRIHSHFTTKYRLTEIILQKDNVNITNGTNMHLFVLFVILL